MLGNLRTLFLKSILCRHPLIDYHRLSGLGRRDTLASDILPNFSSLSIGVFAERLHDVRKDIGDPRFAKLLEAWRNAVNPMMAVIVLVVGTLSRSLEAVASIAAANVDTFEKLKSHQWRLSASWKPLNSGYVTKTVSLDPTQKLNWIGRGVSEILSKFKKFRNINNLIGLGNFSPRSQRSGHSSLST